MTVSERGVFVVTPLSRACLNISFDHQGQRGRKGWPELKMRLRPAGLLAFTVMTVRTFAPSLVL